MSPEHVGHHPLWAGQEWGKPSKGSVAMLCQRLDVAGGDRTKYWRVPVGRQPS